MFDQIKRHIGSAANGVSRFRENSDGTIKILTGFMAIPLVFTLGTAVDTAETYRARVNFQAAVDAAALQAGKTMTRTGSPQEAQTAGERIFHANVENLAPSTGNISFHIPNGECGVEGVTANATLDHDLFFGGARAIANAFYKTSYDEYRDITLNATATVNCGNDTLEIAMVLDNSGSMGNNGKIGTLRTAAADLINTIHNSMGTSLRPDPVSFSLVPFSTFVNIGSNNENQNWMDREGASSIHDEHLDWNTIAGATQVGSSHKWRDASGAALTRFSIYDALDIDWKGCVDQRPWPYHTTDETPSTSNPDSLFLPSFSPDTPDNLSNRDGYEAQLGGRPYCVQWRSNVNDGCYRWSDGYRGRTHPTEGRAYYYSAEYGYNGQWQGGSGGGVYWVNNGPEQEEWYQNNYLRDQHNFNALDVTNHPYNKDHMGTNNGDQYKRQKWASKYFNNADPRDVNNNRSGLPDVVGFEGGPNAWCSSEPITDLTSSRQAALNGVVGMRANGATNVQQGVAWGWRTLSEKQPFNRGRPSSATDNKKIMIVMTDGNNTYYPTNSFYGGYSQRNKSYPGAYGLTVNERIFDGYTDIANPNHDFSTFTKAMDSHLKTTCDNAKDDNLIVYTIAFDVPNGSSVKSMLEYCASPKPGGKKYYDASNNAELIQVFQEIAEDIAELALTN